MLAGSCRLLKCQHVGFDPSLGLHGEFMNDGDPGIFIIEGLIHSGSWQEFPIAKEFDGEIGGIGMVIEEHYRHVGVGDVVDGVHPYQKVLIELVECYFLKHPIVDLRLPEFL